MEASVLCALGVVIAHAGTTMTEPMISQVFFEVLPKVIPLAIGSAISPVILELTFALLARKNYLRKRATAYPAGIIFVIIILATVNSAIGMAQRVSRSRAVGLPRSPISSSAPCS